MELKLNIKLKVKPLVKQKYSNAVRKGKNTYNYNNFVSTKL